MTEATKVFSKVSATILSCTTFNQLTVALKLMDLAINYAVYNKGVPPRTVDMMCISLHTDVNCVMEKIIYA